MVNDLIEIIADRFSDISVININKAEAWIDNIDIGIIDDVEIYIISRIYFYDKSLSVYIYPLDSDIHTRISINYNDFEDVDEFAGMILCKVFYN